MLTVLLECSDTSTLNRQLTRAMVNEEPIGGCKIVAASLGDLFEEVEKLESNQ